MKNFKQIFVIVFFISCLVFSANNFASSYIGDAKKYFEKGEYKAAVIQLKNRLKEKPEDVSARYLLGKSYLKIGDFKQADKEISRAYQLDKNSEEIIVAYAELLLLQRKTQKASDMLNKKFTDPELEKQRLLYLSLVHIEKNQLADAKEILLRLVEHDKNTQAYNALAKLAFQEKDLKVAEIWIDKSLQMEPENIHALQLQAGLEANRKNYTSALKIYDQLIQKQSNKVLLYLKRSIIKIQLSDFKGAEKDIQKILNKNKNHTYANLLLAQIKFQEKNYADAQIAAQNVLNIVPHEQNAMLILGASHFAQGNYNQADKYLVQYVYLVPNNIEAQNLLANVYLAQKKGEQALLILESIDEEKRNNNAKILLSLGGAYLFMGEYQKSVVALNKAKELDPDSKLIQQRLIESQFKIGDIDGAIVGLEKIFDSEDASQRNNYMLIVSYLKKKNIKKAQEQLTKLVQKTPDDPALYNLTAVIERMNGSEKKAGEAYIKAIQLDNKFIPAYIGLADLAIKNQDWAAAKNHYKKVTQIKPDYTKAYIYLAAIAEKQNDLNEIEKILLTGLENSKEYVVSQVSVAQALNKWYIKQKTPEKIMPIAMDINKNYPNNNMALSFLAAAQIANKKNTQAEKTLKIIINNDESDVKHRLKLAALLENQKKKENEVLDLLNSVIEIIPDNPKPVAIKTNFLLKKKRYQQALDTTDYALKQFPDLALGYQLKGDIYRNQKNLDKALNSYKRAYKKQADHKLLLIIVELLNYQGKDAEAITLLEQVLNEDKKNITVHTITANFYQKNKQYKMAAKHYLIILEIKQDHVLALNNLAWIYAQEKNPKAIQLARKAYEKSPDSASIMDTYGYIEINQGDLDKGVILLEQAIALSPKSKNIQYHLAKGYFLQERKEKARTLIKTALNGNSSFSEKENAKALLNQLQ